MSEHDESSVQASQRPSALGLAWDQVAAGYDEYFVPRFAPWVERACQALIDLRDELPAGCLAAPCCGTAPELELLRQAMPTRRLVGVDLSEGMLALARQRLGLNPRELSARELSAQGAAAWPAPGQVTLIAADASDPACWGLQGQRAAAVVSCFGLQQLPQPAQALGAWTRAVAPGGALSIIFWPPRVEDDGPMGWLRQALAQTLPMPQPMSLMALVEAAQAGGGQVLRDEDVRFAMRHEDAATFWQAVSCSGPLRALALGQGPETMQALRQAFMRLAPSGPLIHHPAARHLVIRLSG